MEGHIDCDKITFGAMTRSNTNQSAIEGLKTSQASNKNADQAVQMRILAGLHFLLVRIKTL